MSLTSELVPGLLLDPADNVAVALRPLAAGSVLDVGSRSIVALSDMPRGHKVALIDINIGDAVMKYGEVIGRATAPISAGAHVHVHNIVSGRLPDPKAAS